MDNKNLYAAFLSNAATLCLFFLCTFQGNANAFEYNDSYHIHRKCIYSNDTINTLNNSSQSITVLKVNIDTIPFQQLLKNIISDRIIFEEKDHFIKSMYDHVDSKCNCARKRNSRIYC